MATPGPKFVGARKRMNDFLRLVAEGYPIVVARKKLGINDTTVRNWRRDLTEFDAAYRDAKAMADALFETEARRRALKGVPEDVYHKGVVVGRIQRYSDGLLSKLLDARMPEKYDSRIRAEKWARRQDRRREATATPVTLTLDAEARRALEQLEAMQRALAAPRSEAA